MKSHDRAFDARLEHRAVAQAALTADTTIATVEQRAQTRTEFVTMIRVESVDIGDNDEEYQFRIEVSNDDFTTTEVACVLSLGATEARLGGAPDTVAGDAYEMHWVSEVNGTQYKDWRLVLDVSGTSPSIAFSSNTAV